MYASPLEVRRIAAVLESLRVDLDRERAAASGPLSAPVETDSQWSAALALRALTAALDEALARVLLGCAQTAEGLRAAADAYEAADDRAAGRLVAARRAPW